MIKTPYMQNKEERITNDEVKLFKVFKGRDNLLKILRKVFYQSELTEKEANFIKSLGRNTVEVMEKVFVPSINWQDPIFQQKNIWVDERYPEVIQTFLASEAKVMITAKQSAIRFLKKGIDRLYSIIEGEDKIEESSIDLNMELDYGEKTAEETKKAFVEMADALRYLESGLFTLKSFADKPITEDELKEQEEKNKKDSLK